MAILTGKKILEELQTGDVSITPFTPEHVNPNSVDLTLGPTYLTYDCIGLDSRKDNPTTRSTFEDSGLMLRPGALYLCHTVERIHTKKYVPRIDGKSSIARLGIQVHLTAGFGDTGFDGQFTLEILVALPVRVYPGMRICQISFEETIGELTDYGKKGNYVGAFAEGPVASRSHKQVQ